jgi:hypothetical protein
MMKPDWWMWDAHEEVVIWQAVALSLNIDPEAMSGNQLMRANGYSGGSIDPIGDGYTDGEFDKRRRLLEKRYAKEPSVGYLDQDGEVQYIDNKIVLHDVARLLTSLGREVPYEFASFSEAVITTPLTPSGINISTELRPAIQALQVPKKPRGRMRQQQEAIVDALKNLGYTMGNIPRGDPGKHGLRSEIHAIVQSNELFTADGAYDKAYDRVLREDKELAENGTTSP